MTASTDPTAAAVLQFWFGDEAVPREAWFRKDPAFDRRIAQTFGAQIEQALAGGLTAWDATPDGALARIVLLDQFTRNAFRDTPHAFAGDALALAAAQALRARGDDLALPPLRRVFAYLPFEHAEDMALQRQSVALFESLAAADPALEPQADYARRHALVIERFGRFPHRNAVLGRVSSAEEEAFLQQPGSRF
jgi:uncharacterized protein (DUF924 family)